MERVSKNEARQRNQRTFFTGKACKRGHIAERLVSNSSCVECRKDRWRQENQHDYLKYMIRNARARSKKFDIPCTITPDDIDLPTHCPCCLTVLDVRAERTEKTGHSRTNSPSLDRKIPELGYVAGNVAVLCVRCNGLKSGIDGTMIRFLLEYVPEWMQDVLAQLQPLEEHDHGR